MKKRVLKTLIFILSLAATLVAGAGAGIFYANLTQPGHTQPDTIRLIAVVNLDEGISIDEERLNYAAHLVPSVSDNFATVSLSEARNGVAAGNFAAYIIIPTTFSASAQSINARPEAIQIEFALNSNLKEDVRTDVLREIHDFENILNSNLSYMYISAILKEFHNVQDSASTLMKNDIRDLASIESVEPGHIMAELIYELPAEIQNIIENIDLTILHDENIGMVELITRTFEEFYDEASAGFAQMKERINSVSDPVDILSKTLASFDPAYDSSGNLVYKGGIASLTEMFIQHNLKLLDDKKYQTGELALLLNNVSGLLAQADALIDETEQSHNQTLYHNEKLINGQIDESNAQIDRANKQMDDANSRHDNIRRELLGLGSELSSMEIDLAVIMRELDLMKGDFKILLNDLTGKGLKEQESSGELKGLLEDITGLLAAASFAEAERIIDEDIIINGINGIEDELAKIITGIEGSEIGIRLKKSLPVIIDSLDEIILSVNAGAPFDVFDALYELKDLIALLNDIARLAPLEQMLNDIDEVIASENELNDYIDALKDLKSELESIDGYAPLGGELDDVIAMLDDIILVTGDEDTKDELTVLKDILVTLNNSAPPEDAIDVINLLIDTIILIAADSDVEEALEALKDDISELGNIPGGTSLDAAIAILDDVLFENTDHDLEMLLNLLRDDLDLLNDSVLYETSLDAALLSLDDIISLNADIALIPLLDELESELRQINDTLPAEITLAKILAALNTIISLNINDDITESLNDLKSLIEKLGDNSPPANPLDAVISSVEAIIITVDTNNALLDSLGVLKSSLQNLKDNAADELASGDILALLKEITFAGIKDDLNITLKNELSLILNELTTTKTELETLLNDLTSLKTMLEDDAANNLGQSYALEEKLIGITGQLDAVTFGKAGAALKEITKQAGTDRLDAIDKKVDKANLLKIVVEKLPDESREALNKAFSANIENLDLKLFLDIDVEELSGIALDEIVAVIEKHVGAQMDLIDADIHSLMEGTLDYLKEIEQYEPYSDFSHETVSDAQNKLAKNTREIQSDSNDKFHEYLSHVFDIERRFLEVDRTLSESLGMAYNFTGENLSNTLAGLRQNRADIHGENLSLLSDFSNKLGYTRLGSVSNTDVYDFIVKPVGMRQTVVQRSSTLVQGVGGNEIWLVALTSIVALLGAFLLHKVLAYEDNKTVEGDKKP